jgi:ketosteroid isomerase-like protein
MELQTSTAENLALARQMFSWFKNRDMDAFFAALHPDVKAQPSIGGGVVLEGRDELSAWWRRFASGEADIEVRPLDFESRGDCVVVRGYLRQREGRVLAENEVYWVCEICNGQIKRMAAHPTRSSALADC